MQPPENFAFASASLSSAFAQSQSPTFKPAAITDLTATFTQTTLGSLIYDLDGGEGILHSTAHTHTHTV